MTIKSRLLLGVALCISSSTAVLADDFIIDGPATTTNNGEVLDGDDTITVTDTGSVSTATTVNNEPALFAVGDNNVLTNRGDVTTGSPTTGNDSRGLHAIGNNNVLTNSGDVSTIGDGATGLYAVGDNNVLTNSGDVSTLGSIARGLHALGDFNTIINTRNGVVSMALSADGLYAGTFSTGDHNTIINQGIIIIDSVGAVAFAMYAGGDYNILMNSGNITVTSLAGHGLTTNAYGISNFNTLTNSGTVTVSGVGGHGLFANGASNTITNSGTVLSELGYSVNITGTDATLNLLSGSVLFGKVNIDEFSTATLNFGSGLNAAVTLSSDIPSSGFTITAPGPVTVLEDTVYVADLGDVAAQNRVNTIATRMIHDAVASRGIVPAVTQGSSQPSTWASVSGGLVRNSGDGNLSGYDGNVVSGSFGRDRLDGTSTFGGVSLTQTKTDNGVATDAISVHGGIYGQLAGADYTLSGGLGYLDTERERANNMLASGLETASDSYLSAFISPAMTWHGVLGDNDSLRLRYTGTFYGSQSFDYEGEGDLEVESRITHQIEVRMAWARVIENSTIRYGFDLGYQGDDAMDLTLAGQNLSATTPGDAAYGRVFASMDFANATVEASYDNNNEFGLTGSYSWRF
jgi:hypothetical protein